MKNQLKKSLSLLMAVLMIMSCWVWVAPEKAAAEDLLTGYELVVNTGTSNTIKGKYSLYVKYWPIEDGVINKSKSSTHYIHKQITGGLSTSTAYSTGVLNGFPYEVVSTVTANTGANSDTENKIGIASISINGKVVMDAGSQWSIEAKGGGTDSDTFGINSSGAAVGTLASQNFDVENWQLPQFAFSTDMPNSIDIKAPKFGGSDTTATVTASFKDGFYGVKWYGSVSQVTNTTYPNIKLAKDSTTKSEMAISGSGLDVTVTAKSGADRYGDAGAAESKWKAQTQFTSNGSPLTADFDVTVEHPTYSVSLDANGGNTSIKKIDGDFYYGSNIFTIAGLDAAPGYDAEGNATGEVNKEFCQLAGWTSAAAPLNGWPSGSYVTLNSSTTVTQDMTFYARWETADISVKFESADGQELATLTSKYGMSVVNKFGSAADVYSRIYNNKVSNPNLITWSQVTTNEGAFYAPEWKQDGMTYRFKGYKIVEAYDMDNNAVESLKSGNLNTALQGHTVFRAVYEPVNTTSYTIELLKADGSLLSSQTKKYGETVTLPTEDVTLTDATGRYEYTHIGWAPKYGANYYTVDENGLDENGGKISFINTTLDTAIFLVEGDATYVPVFRREYIDYTVNLVYYIDDAVEETVTVEGYHLDDSIVVPEEVALSYTHLGSRHYITGWKLDKNGATGTGKEISSFAVTGDMTLYADYNKQDAATYVIRFYDINKNLIGAEYDDQGNLINEDDFVYEHNAPVNVPTVGDGEGFDIPNTIDTEDKLYTYTGWSETPTVLAGKARDYYAVYSEQTYADVVFYNEGKEIYRVEGNKNALFEGDKIPLYDEETYGIPEKAADKIGTYSFKHWVDNNGNKVEPGTTTLTGDIELHAYFDIEYIDYTVIFENDDGTEISKATYHYGEDIVKPAVDPTKAADEKYNYEFRSWSPEVSDKCYGTVTYTAVYNRNYNYYSVTWYKDDLSVAAKPYYIYGERIFASLSFDPVNPSEALKPGHKWIISGWVLCNAQGQPLDADGNVTTEENAVKHSNAMKMPAENIYFYPIFEQKINVYEVKFYDESGTKYIGSEYVEHGAAPETEAYESAAKKASDATYHYKFDKWVLLDGFADLGDTITSDCSAKAVLVAEKHNPTISDVIKYPTCTEKGIAEYKCDTDYCDQDAYQQEIDVIPDFGAPSITVQLGSKIWAANSTVDFTEKQFVSARTNIIASANDTNLRSQYNPEGKITRRVGTMDYYVSESVIENPANISESAWINAYNYDSVYAQELKTAINNAGMTEAQFNALADNDAKKTEILKAVSDYMYAYEANIGAYVEDLGLVDGKEYIVYVRASDRKVGTAEVNTSYASTGWFSYGSTAPTITITGAGQGAALCTSATITVKDDTANFVILVDGKEVTATLSADGKTATFDYNTANLHTISVTDKHGNKTTKTFTINGKHSYNSFAISATCIAAGSKYDMCSLCGDKTNVVTIEAKGHDLSRYTEKAPDCLNDGYRTYTCGRCNAVSVKVTPDLTVTATSSNFANEADKASAEIAALEKLIEDMELTAEDLKHLKATGNHTYAKVKDEAGNDTAEDAWVIDKAATCISTGSKHKDCTVCGERVTKTIEADTENGHKFYREKVTSEPLCQEIGKKTKTCRYCGYEETTGYIDALGHVAGEYVTLKAATCEEPGSEMLTCAVCGSYIGEGVYDPMKEPVAKVIPALGHAYKIDGDVYSEEVEQDGETVTVWYQNYMCSVCGKVDKRKLDDYKPPVAATVTFDFNGGSYEIPAVGSPNELGYVPPMLKGTQTISTFVGEAIVASDVEAAFKQNNATYTYSFSHWATKNDDGTFTQVKFPIEVKGDATYYAIYTEKYINYTITYNNEDGTEFKKTGYLHNNEEVELADGPSKAGDWQYTYKFIGWAVVGSDPEVVYTDKLTIKGADIILKAKYEKVTRKYAVTYAYSKNDILETFAVEAGEVARDCGITPVKAFDSTYHYTFKAWNKAVLNKDTGKYEIKVESNVYTTPDYTAVKHDFDETIKSEATCAANKVIIKTCDCGYSYEEEVKNSALDHIWGDPVYNEETDKNTVTCQRQGCGESTEDTRTFTAEFFVNADDEHALKKVYYLAWGTTIDATKLPANPTKDADATYTYTFKGWAIEGTTDIVDFTKFEIKQDYKFVAVFTATIREYNVTFRSDGNTIYTVTVKAGTNVVYDEATYGTPVKACDDNHHYTFKGWSESTENVQENLVVNAEFTTTKHNTTRELPLNEATCTNGKGIRYWCDCNGNDEFDPDVDYSYDKEISKPLDHTMEEIERVEATPNRDGYVKTKCSVCGYTETEVLKYADNKATITVTVTYNGAPKSGVKVIVQPLGGGEQLVATTNKDGVATISNAVQGTVYSAWVEIDGENKAITLLADGKNWIGSYNYKDADVDCTCACHRTNFWGTIFRFFHKIIKLFTGEFKCCGNPDPMYG